ncbi:hypothetical protein JG688_00005045 [Phytophthora aleatoria]|uniref:Uncharacterized protein n=1 Tax=Phytophthora aleatoria TaxID=2496075 RepID=A0A8J5ISC2_9STRA|nr:hypothetical protein JG688_00005045 [Phytophthora aleatoria]
MSLTTGDANGQHSATEMEKKATPVLTAEANCLCAVYRSPEQERVNYLEGRLIELMKELENEKSENERLTAALDERDDLLSESRTELIQAYETSMQIRADMLELLQKLQHRRTDFEAELLAETTALHIALKARELHRHMLKQLQAVDEPEDHHEQKKTARPGMQGETKGAVVGDAEDLRRQATKMVADLERQGGAMRELRGDYERTLDTIYELETQRREGELTSFILAGVLAAERETAVQKLEMELSGAKDEKQP